MFSQPSQPKPGTEMGLSRKYLWGTILSNGLGLYKLGGRPASFLKKFYQQKCCQPGLKGTEEQNERKMTPRAEP